MIVTESQKKNGNFDHFGKFKYDNNKDIFAFCCIYVYVKLQKRQFCKIGKLTEFENKDVVVYISYCQQLAFHLASEWLVVTEN